jgi:hypothetical protein
MMAVALGRDAAMVATRAGQDPRTKGGLVTLGTVVGLIGAMAITLFGTGAADNAIASYDASSWLWSSNRGEIARVNGVTGRVDTRYKVTDAQGHTMQVSQNDRYVILRDLNTGKISVLDLSSLRIGANTDSTPGLGVSVALHNDTAFVIDSVQGLVRQLDPATLNPIGQPLSFPPGLVGGTFDDAGRLWLLVPSEGTAVAVKPAVTASPKARGGQGGQAGVPDPAVLRTVDVADPSHDLTLSILDTGVAVLDKTATMLTTLRGESLRKVALSLSGPGAMPIRTVGADVPVTVVDDRHVYVVTGDKVVDFTVPGNSPKLQPCVAWTGRLYCADDATGNVYVLDARGQLTSTFQVPSGGRGLDLEVREQHLFINAPDASTARVVDGKHRVRVVDKYANNILGGDPPPNPPPAPPTRPAVSAPSAPARVSAVAGNASARVTWSAAAANGAAIMKYVVEGDGQVREVGANQRAIDITGLTNGREYRFTVYAVNARGNGPKRGANPVVPTAEVPDPPLSVNATANPDGTVNVTWPAANGQGRRVIRYEVTPVSAGTQGQTISSDGTTLVIQAGQLTYGTIYAFRVQSVNDRGASSALSPPSNSVTPFTRPAAPRGLQVRTTTTQRGSITATWAAPQDNGRPITGYQVTANGTAQNVPAAATSVTLNGYPDGATITVAVRAVNVAGAGQPANGSAATLRQPTITVTGATSGTSTATVNMAVNDGGGTPARCAVQFPTTAIDGSCQSLTVGGLRSGTTFPFTVTTVNAAGMTATATGTATTQQVWGTVLCTDQAYCGRPGDGIWVYTGPNQVGAGVDDVYAPERYQARCRTTGGQVDARPWGGKNSNVWILIVFPGTREHYLPFAWFRLDNGDNLNQLAQC